MKIIVFSLIICLLSTLAFAHPGGHYKQNKDVLNQWELKDGKIVKGNFSFSINKEVYLEQYNGKIISYTLGQFSNQDQLFLKEKIRRAAQFNQQPFAFTKSTPINKNPSIILLTILLIGFVFLLYQIPTERFIPSTTLFQHLRPIIAGSFVLIYIIACTKKETTTPSNINNNSSSSIPKTRITFLDSAFQLYKPAISTNSDNTYYYVAGNGIPTHGMMIGITSWQQQVPIPQAYTGSNSWSIPLQPSYATTPLSTKSNLMKGAVAIAINGIPIFNALNNRGEDSYAIGELDNWGGHCGRADDYHYHAAPMHLNESTPKLPIAIGLDGFSVYGSKEPNGNMMNALDTCHGHIGDDGIYHYHGTSTYPYVIGAMKGKVNLDPSTPAPENQILPQAFAKAARPALTPLKGAVITDFKANGSNGYNLTYKIGTKFGYVNYSWDANNKFTYTLIDTAGVSTTTTYQR
ncbi:MAG: YHYH protein [Chitinophagia bacterium]|jgi:YHYH protein|nr:YHYH protein [Chitinophagia bacterium]